MKFLKLLPILLIFTGVLSYENSIRAEVKNANQYKVLSTSNKTLTIANVKDYLKQGDEYIKSGDFDRAKEMERVRFAQEKREISKNYTIAPAYNKGAYQVIPKKDIKHIGK